jgi:hypothetical protein
MHAYYFLTLLKKRQWGGSLITGVDSLIQAMILPNFTTLILSKSGDDAAVFLDRIIKMYNSLPEPIKELYQLKKNPTLEHMEFMHNSKLISLPANRGEGYTGNRVIIDEAARINKQNSHITLVDVLNNVVSVVEKAKGQLFLVSKASGYGLFHNYYQLGKDIESKWHSFFASCYDDPSFTQEMRKQIVIDFGEDFANENYPENDTQAFLSSGKSYFYMPNLQKFTQRDVITSTKGYIDKLDNRFWFRENESGWVEIFEKPEPKVSYVIGSDISEGIEIEGVVKEKQKTDLSTAEVFKQVGDKYIQVAKIVCRLNPKLFAEELYRLAIYYNYAFLCVERNKDGLGVLLDLKDTYKYKNLYYQEDYNPDTQVRQKKLGWTTGKITKPVLLRTADDLIRKEQTVFRSERTISEFMTMVSNNGKVGAESGCHDDEAMASMIAFECFSKAPKTAIKSNNNLDDYRRKKAKDREKEFEKVSGY